MEVPTSEDTKPSLHWNQIIMGKYGYICLYIQFILINEETFIVNQHLRICKLHWQQAIRGKWWREKKKPLSYDVFFTYYIEQTILTWMRKMSPTDTRMTMPSTTACSQSDCCLLVSVAFSSECVTLSWTGLLLPYASHSSTDVLQESWTCALTAGDKYFSLNQFIWKVEFIIHVYYARNTVPSSESIKAYGIDVTWLFVWHKWITWFHLLLN